ncbi:hypothetical protein CBR_g36377 [Chara braunii]|uniref:CCHC-type domain-containing protein n=1 Tax=Chara braunii TaxID=69332 RepID=A0A388LKL4_CHABU|nr:hypothetical protein CBR_g36377 [Chara braunii]|eukprot:GBG82849.1 hypothetical protein CBR_g36377 [Chara braunii]
MTGRGNCFTCGLPGHFSRECNQRLGYSYGRPPVATGTNAQPLLALPAPATVTPQAVTPIATTAYVTQPRGGFWRANQETLDRCNAFISRAEQKEKEQEEEAQRVKKKQEEEETANRVKKEREEFEAQMGQRLENRLTVLREALLGKGGSNASTSGENEELSRLPKENEELCAKISDKGKTSETKVIEQLKRENEVLRRSRTEDENMGRELPSLRRELHEVRDNRTTVGKEEFEREIECLRDELELLKEKIDMQRCDQAEVDLLKEKRAAAELKRMQAENEILRLREEMSKLSTKQTVVETPKEKETNLMKQLNEAATEVQKSRRGKVKATPRRFSIAESSAKKANDMFVFVQDEKNRLKALKKKGLKPVCVAVGIKYKTIDTFAEELAQYNADQVFGSHSEPDLGNTGEDGIVEGGDNSTTEDGKCADVLEVPSDTA